MTKEVVDLKLQSNLLQQNAIKQIQELKAKVNNYFIKGYNSTLTFFLLKSWFSKMFSVKCFQ